MAGLLRSSSNKLCPPALDIKFDVELSAIHHQSLGQSLPRQRVGALVELVAGMPLHPAPVDLMAQARGVEPLPEVVVLHRLLVGGQPAAPLPAVDPLVDALLDILTVG